MYKYDQIRGNYPSSEVYPMMKEKKKEGREGMRGERERGCQGRERALDTGRENKNWRDVPGGPVAKISCSQGRGPGFSP